MSESSAKRMDCYLSFTKSKAETHSESKINETFGMHFLSQIKKLKNELIFDKIHKIQNSKWEQEDKQKMNKDIEFYQSKIENLGLKLFASKLELLKVNRKNIISKMEISGTKQTVNELRLIDRLMKLKQAKLDSEVEDLKKIHDSKKRFQFNSLLFNQEK